MRPKQKDKSTFKVHVYPCVEHPAHTVPVRLTGHTSALLTHMQTDTERQTHEEQEYRNEIVADHRFRAQNTLSALNKGLKENKSYTI